MASELSYVEAYLNRIKYAGKIDVSFETLQGLHTAHTLNIPFENLDVYYKKPIHLDKDSLFKKIVQNNRGGYCYEMNSLFSFVLQEIGFKVTNLLSRPTRDGINFSAKTHQIMMVEIGKDKWLADVGFGRDGITAPLLLETESDQKQFTHTYRLIKDTRFGYLLQKKDEGGYTSMYAFTLEECYPMDLVMSNHFSSTYPESIFTSAKWCTIPTKEGRITLTDRHFKTVVDGKVSEIMLSDDFKFNELLKKHFGLDLDLIK